jgi:hypothetical protein
MTRNQRIAAMDAESSHSCLCRPFHGLTFSLRPYRGLKPPARAVTAHFMGLTARQHPAIASLNLVRMRACGTAAPLARLTATPTAQRPGAAAGFSTDCLTFPGLTEKHPSPNRRSPQAPPSDLDACGRRAVFHLSGCQDAPYDRLGSFRRNRLFAAVPGYPERCPHGGTAFNLRVDAFHTRSLLVLCRHGKGH